MLKMVFNIRQPYIENNDVCHAHKSGHGYPMKIIEIHFHFIRKDIFRVSLYIGLQQSTANVIANVIGIQYKYC